MELVITILILLLVISGMKWRTKQPVKSRKSKNKNVRISNLNLTFDRAKKEFLELNVSKRHDRIVICEIEKLGGKSKELIFIRLVSEPKTVRLSTDGRYLIARYPYVPTKEEMRNDFSIMLNKRR